ncbi:Glycosyl transferase family 2 [Pseudomonas benzenivorans]|nr:glycosyltransferase [Pseudomonas benzenivorans]SDH17182.1 Glycosyl transferase family 2 [Pseudomonas benzenivorans]
MEILELEHRPVKVSVCVVSYNQEKYIGTCLESLVSQLNPEEYEILIGDDASTDKTPDIINEFSALYPELIFPVLHKKNIGAFKNYISVHRRARGKYICHMDGDDYALPLKIKKQVDFLDANSNCSAVVHKLRVLKSGVFQGETKENPELIDMEYLLLSHPSFLHSSLMYRRKFADDFLKCGRDFIDFYVYVCLVSRGPIGFISEALGVYRSGIGISRSLKLMPLIQMAIDKAKALGCDEEVIERGRAKQYLSYAVASLLTGKYSDFQGHIVQAYKFYPRNSFVIILYRFRWMPIALRFIIHPAKKIFSIVQGLRLNKGR